MLDTRNHYRKITAWITTIAIAGLLATTCLSNTYNIQSIIGLCIVFLLLCIIGLAYKTTTIQHLRPLILLTSLVYFGFIMGGCPCLLFYFQGFILFILGKSAFWIPFMVIITIIITSIIFGTIWCGWICVLGALQEFIYQKNRWNILKSKKAQKCLLYIQAVAFVALVLWIMVAQRPVICAYDPFISIFKLKIFNWIGYITVPLLLLSSLFIYRPFCRIVCPVAFILYIVKFLPFAKKLTIHHCTHCNKCHSYCKLNAIQDGKIAKTCIMCGECKKAGCNLMGC